MRHPTHSPAALLRRFRRDEGGAYAIEFAFFGSLLLALMLVLMQYTVVLLARQNLETALQTATRSLLTGSFQNDNIKSTDQAAILANMRNLMCGGSPSPAVFFKCENLKVDVQVSGTYNNNLWNTSAVDTGSGDWSKGFGTGYKCPSARSIAIVRAAVKVPLLTPLFLKLGIDSFSDGAALLQSASVFRVEPYQSSNPAAC